MATTTNYGWATPDDTDLVKDGAAAIRTLGSSADTTVKALSPGTTAGDLDYYTSGTAKARLGIGTAGQVLQVNSGATAPEWATVSSSPTFSGARVYASATQSFGNATAAAFTWDSESYDTDSYHSTVTNTSRLTVPTTGYYLISTSINWASNSTGVRILELKKNNVGVGYIEQGSDDSCAQTYTVPLYATAAEYFEVVGYQNSGGTLTTLAGGDVFGFFSIVSLGA